MKMKLEEKQTPYGSLYVLDVGLSYVEEYELWVHNDVVVTNNSTAEIEFPIKDFGLEKYNDNIWLLVPKKGRVVYYIFHKNFTYDVKMKFEDLSEDIVVFPMIYNDNNNEYIYGYIVEVNAGDIITLKYTRMVDNEYEGEQGIIIVDTSGALYTFPNINNTRELLSILEKLKVKK